MADGMDERGGESNIHRNFEEGLGNIVNADRSLEFERPFLGPLYNFLTIHPRSSVRRVPIPRLHSEVLGPPSGAEQASPLRVGDGFV